MIDKLLAAFRIPPHTLGVRKEPETREAAARERLAYATAMDINPFSMGDNDMELVVSADTLWHNGVIDREEASIMLRPLQEPPCR